MVVHSYHILYIMSTENSHLVNRRALHKKKNEVHTAAPNALKSESFLLVLDTRNTKIQKRSCCDKLIGNCF